MLKKLLAIAAFTGFAAASSVAAPADYKVEGTARVVGTSSELTVKVLNVPTGKYVKNAKVYHFSAHQMAKGPAFMELRHFVAPDGNDGYRIKLPLHIHDKQVEHFMIRVPGEGEAIHARIELPVVK